MPILARCANLNEHTIPLLDNFDGCYRGTSIVHPGYNYTRPVNYVSNAYTDKDLDNIEFYGDYVLLANEVFNDQGLQNTKLYKKYGHDYIRVLYDLARSKTNAPLFICDCRPRKLRTWRAILKYIKDYDMTEVGLGIQYHVDLRTSQASKIIEAGTLSLLDSIRRASGSSIAVPEITVWRSGASIEDMRQAYQRIIDYSKANAVYGLIWTVFQQDEWHWQAFRRRNNDQESSIYTADYRPKFNLRIKS